jgi:hypothetical protein
LRQADATTGEAFVKFNIRLTLNDPVTFTDAFIGTALQEFFVEASFPSQVGLAITS